MILNHQNAQNYFKWSLLFVYIIIIALSNLYIMDNVERLTQMYKYNILVFFEFSIICSLNSIHKSTIYTMIFFMISSMGLYYYHCVLEQFGLELRTNMNTNALKIVHVQSLYSTYLSFMALFCHIKSPKCTKLF
jgi:hypothetical protein